MKRIFLLIIANNPLRMNIKLLILRICPEKNGKNINYYSAGQS